MSLQPLGLQQQGHVHGVTGRRQAALRRTAGRVQGPVLAKAVPLVPWQRGERRGKCHCLPSPFHCLAPCSQQLEQRSEMFSSTFLTSTIVHRDPTHPRDSPHTRKHTTAARC